MIIIYNSKIFPTQAVLNFRTISNRIHLFFIREHISIFYILLCKWSKVWYILQQLWSLYWLLLISMFYRNHFKYNHKSRVEFSKNIQSYLSILHQKSYLCTLYTFVYLIYVLIYFATAAQCYKSLHWATVAKYIKIYIFYKSLQILLQIVSSLYRLLRICLSFILNLGAIAYVAPNFENI